MKEEADAIRSSPPDPTDASTPLLSRDHVLSRAMERATGARRVEGNRVNLQFDGPITFEAWLEAIRAAERFIHFENYVLRNDDVGRAFRDALVERARAGVQVRVLYDWVGSWATPRRYWKPFREAGVEVRAFNRPSIRDPYGVFQRDHRKLVCVDGHVAFVGGFCVGGEWAGSRDDPPWRDTGVAIRGPAAAVAAGAFEGIWAEVGAPVPREMLVDSDAVEPAGDTPVWVIEGAPWRTRVYRATQLVAAHARRRIWITDPYFVAPRPVTEGLIAAARDGVDVRIVVPAHNNWPWVGSLSRGGYRRFLEAGVRIFEWQGPMIHAKTSVVDGVWCRVGSSNLNLSSLLGNWEIDAGILDVELAQQLEGLFLADLASCVEIILPGGPVYQVAGSPGRAEPAPRKASLDPPASLQERLDLLRESSLQGGSWRMADLVRAGTALGEAIAGRRVVGREDRTVLGTVAVLLLVLAGLAAFFPSWIGWTLAVVLGWLGIVTGVRSLSQARRARIEEEGYRASRAVEAADSRSGDRTEDPGGSSSPSEG